ncbi:MAG: hypothetical protein OXG56_04535 [Gammaproteobacteria bacterium]|nr:hypothetical protein [Gammaproteobacteria bacterium]
MRKSIWRAGSQRERITQNHVVEFLSKDRAIVIEWWEESFLLCVTERLKINSRVLRLVDCGDLQFNVADSGLPWTVSIRLWCGEGTAGLYDRFSQRLFKGA